MSGGKRRVVACEVCGTEVIIPDRVVLLHGKKNMHCPTCDTQTRFAKVERKGA